MRSKIFLSAMAALAAVALTAVAADLKSGLQPGKPIGAFDVAKCAGAADDGVKVGSVLCYRCKYGARPMVMVFSRGANDAVATLASKLDQAVAQHSDKKLAAFVNLLGENKDELVATAKDFGAKNKLANVPVVVPVEFDNGPGDYGLNPKADVTVILATGGTVKANKSFAKGELDSKGIESVLAAVPELLK